MPLSAVQLKVDHWSKCVLIGSTLLLVYSLAVLGTVADHHHHHHHHGFHHGRPEDGPCRVRHFALLGTLTGITGMTSAFKMTRGYALAFMVLVLITEVVALSLIGFFNVKAVHQCQAGATSEKFIVERTDVKLSNGMHFRADHVVGEAINVDRPALHDCLDNVRHSAVLASLIVGVVACSLACCSSRYSNALFERDAEEATEAVVAAIVAGGNTGGAASAQQMRDLAPVVAVVVPSSNPDAKCEPSPMLV